MPLSEDPEARARQLANLRQGGGPNAGSWEPGQASPTLTHGLRTRRPPGPLLGEAASEIVDALAETVPLRAPDGGVMPQFIPAVEAAAVDLIIVRRALGFLTAKGWEDARGRLRPEVDGLSKANARFMAKLDALGATPVSYARLGFDVARTARETRDYARAWSAPPAPPVADVEHEEGGPGAG